MQTILWVLAAYAYYSLFNSYPPQVSSFLVTYYEYFKHFSFEVLSAQVSCSCLAYTFIVVFLDKENLLLFKIFNIKLLSTPSLSNLSFFVCNNITKFILLWVEYTLRHTRTFSTIMYPTKKRKVNVLGCSVEFIDGTRAC